jgi:hypothetical protein
MSSAGAGTAAPWPIPNSLAWASNTLRAVGRIDYRSVNIKIREL